MPLYLAKRMGNVVRGEFADLPEGLRVGDDNARLHSEGVQGGGEFGVAADDRHCSDFKDIADGLLLREYQATFRRG